MAELYPDINDYLDQVGYEKPITAEGLEDLVNKIVIHTGLSYDTCEILVKSYFEVIRNEMLNGYIIHLSEIGKIYISCPKNGTSKKRVTPKIKLLKKIRNKIKYDDD